MCTAISYATKHHYFGRNMDFEYSYQETVTITPRKYPFSFRCTGTMDTHYAMIGMAYISDAYPLYYDATNEKGLSMAGLNFPDHADYKPEASDKDNIAPFEFIPWILGQCANVEEARKLLTRINLVNISFSKELPLSPLHWIISDRAASIVVESVKEGLFVYDNPIHVLTNNPPFPYHLYHLCDYMGASREAAVNRFCETLPLKPYSRGMGAFGLPGDLSSASRFVKAAFGLLNSVAGETEAESISQFFHILQSVAQPRGSVQIGDSFEITIYSSCCNTDLGIYYYTTYENQQISGVDMNRENLDGSSLIAYPLISQQQIRMQN